MKMLAVVMTVLAILVSKPFLAEAGEEQMTVVEISCGDGMPSEMKYGEFMHDPPQCLYVAETPSTSVLLKVSEIVFDQERNMVKVETVRGGVFEFPWGQTAGSYRAENFGLGGVYWFQTSDFNRDGKREQVGLFSVDIGWIWNVFRMMGEGYPSIQY